MTATLDPLTIAPVSSEDPAPATGPVLRGTTVLATAVAAAITAAPVAAMIVRSHELTRASSQFLAEEPNPDPTGGAVLVVLALVLCLVPFMVGRAVARRSAAPLLAAGATTVAVAAGFIAQQLLG